MNNWWQSPILKVLTKRQFRVLSYLNFLSEKIFPRFQFSFCALYASLKNRVQILSPSSFLLPLSSVFFFHLHSQWLFSLIARLTFSPITLYLLFPSCDATILMVTAAMKLEDDCFLEGKL